MKKYLTAYNTTAEYEAAVAQGLTKPHVALDKETMEVHFFEYVPMNIITYEASAKLTETTSSGSSGLHTNAFNTTIKSHTFENGVGTIEFNDDVTSIGGYAFFGCSSLTSIEIPNSVTGIRNYAFLGCSSLTSIEIPNSVTSIGDGAFQNCSGLTSIELPNSVTSIRNSAFQNCSSLTSIELPNSVTSIGDGAFYKCSGLTSIELPNSVTSIGDGVFSSCSNLTSIVCNATTAPTIQHSTFYNVKTDGTLTVPIGSTGYDTWMGTGNYYLGKYSWTKVEQ